MGKLGRSEHWMDFSTEGGQMNNQLKWAKIVGFALLLLPLTQCGKLNLDDHVSRFEEDFESATEDTLLFQDSRWTASQLTVEENTITVDTEIVHSGLRSVKFHAFPHPDDDVSKCDLMKQDMVFNEGETVYFRAWYYLIGDGENLFLFDLEEPAPVSSSPGIRLTLSTEERWLQVERGKLEKSTLRQTKGEEIAFPTEQWVKVEFEVKLSRKKKGAVKLWQDDVLVVEEEGVQTMPKDILYFTQGTSGIYQNIQVGITAAGTQNTEKILYVDDFLIETR